MRKKAVPVGIEDFKELIQEGYYYIDKTLLIDEMLMNKSKVTLFTRPRRFGKTLNMSMMKYFFEIENTEENKKLIIKKYLGHKPVEVFGGAMTGIVIAILLRFLYF